VEECFAAAKNETALDHYQVRKHTAWYRHATLAMCAHAWLAVTAAASRPPPGEPAGGPGPGNPPESRQRCGKRPTPAADTRDHRITHGGGWLVHLTVNEIRRLHAIFSCPAHPASCHLHWSLWRRRHQAIARHCHYQRRRQRQ